MEVKETNTLPYTISELDNNVKEIQISISKESYEEEFNSEIKQLSKSVKLKGFRPGKVPTSYVKKIFGKNVINKILQEKIDNTIKEILEKEKDIILVEPVITSEDRIIRQIFNSTSPEGAIHLKYQVKPDFDIEKLKELIKEKIKLYSITLPESEEELLKHLFSYDLDGNKYTPESERFLVVLSPTYLYKEDEIKTEEDRVRMRSNSLLLLVDKNMSPDLYEKFKALGENETTVIEIDKELPLRSFNLMIPESIAYILYVIEKKSENKVVLIQKLDVKRKDDVIVDKMVKLMIEKYKDFLKDKYVRELNVVIYDFVKENIQIDEDLLKLKYGNDETSAIRDKIKFVYNQIRREFPEFQVDIQDFIEKGKEILEPYVPLEGVADDEIMEVIVKDDHLRQKTENLVHRDKVYALLKEIIGKEEEVSLGELVLLLAKELKDYEEDNK